MFSANKNIIFVLVLASMVVLSIVVFYFAHKILLKGRTFKKPPSTPSVEELLSVSDDIVVQPFQSNFPISLLGKLSGCTISQEKIIGSCERSGEPSTEKYVVLEALSRECSQEEKCELVGNLLRVRSVLPLTEQSIPTADDFCAFFLDVFATMAVQGTYSAAASGATLHIPFPMRPLAPGRVSEVYVSRFVEGFLVASASHGGGSLVASLNLAEIKFCCSDSYSFQMLAHAFNNSTIARCVGGV
ncbi:hypothetical protein [Neorickettsia sennetsu]|uniref:Uncharacterized protein n=1 Tax=Ehrlichia sennetsu (strain ATCC VR-367 / Miyayama) TaxID=222891 RepID=Q2GET1_EHRS3|nr:hypothetical protein [Neorickettsia sennetsu]ABD45979.1 hypothetical protein NSE_0115 [Neorickettsia sennetsu str. Miyayama]